MAFDNHGNYMTGPGAPMQPFQMTSGGNPPGGQKSMVARSTETCRKANVFPDFVFVDEHNRHKRLKGMQLEYHLKAMSDLLFAFSDEGL